MAGLLQRAIQLREALRSAGVPIRDTPGTGEESALADIDSEEKAQILKQIDEIVARNRMSVDDAAFDFSPQKTGAGLPLIINLVAVLVLVGGVFGAYRLFNSRESSIVTESEAVLSTEGQLLKALKEESDQALSEKDREIADIQTRLEDARRSREQLQEETEQRIQERETALRAEMSRALEEERQRLEEQGVSAEDMEARLREFEDAKNRDFTQQLADARQEFEAEQAERMQAMQAVISDYQDTLQQAETERRSLEESLKAREAELENRYREKESSLEADKARIAEELELLGRRQEQEDLVMDQILSMYGRINDNIKSAAYDAALQNLNALTEYLSQESVASLGIVRERRSIENFLIASLRKLIENEQGREKIDTDSLLASANRLAVASSVVESANKLYAQGRIEDARTEYEKALTMIPDLEAGYSRLKEIEENLIRGERSRLDEVLAQGDERYRTEEYQESLEIYRQALSYFEDDSQRLKEMLNNVLDTGFRMGSEAEKKRAEPVQAALERRTAELESQIVDLRSRQEDLLKRQRELSADYSELEQDARNLSTANEQLRQERRTLEEEYADLDRERKTLETELVQVRRRARELEAEREAIISHIDSISDLYLRNASVPGSSGDTRGPADEDTVMALLQTKLLVKEILASDTVKAQYPDLYDAMDEYFEAYGDQKEQAGKEGLMSEIIALTEYLSEGRDPEEVAALLDAEDDADMRRMLLEFLGSLKDLMGDGEASQ